MSRAARLKDYSKPSIMGFTNSPATSVSARVCVPRYCFRHFAIKANSIVLVVMLALAFSYPSVADAASFDCSGRKNPLETLICADDELSTLDENVATNYFSLVEVYAQNAMEKQRLLSSQRDFLRQRTATCPIPNTPIIQEVTSNQIIECLKGAYALRLRAMEKELVDSEHAAPPESESAEVPMPKSGNEESLTVNKDDDEEAGAHRDEGESIHRKEKINPDTARLKKMMLWSQVVFTAGLLALIILLKRMLYIKLKGLVFFVVNIAGSLRNNASGCKRKLVESTKTHLMLNTDYDVDETSSEIERRFSWVRLCKRGAILAILIIVFIALISSEQPTTYNNAGYASSDDSSAELEALRTPSLNLVLNCYDPDTRADTYKIFIYEQNINFSAYFADRITEELADKFDSVAAVIIEYPAANIEEEKIIFYTESVVAKDYSYNMTAKKIAEDEDSNIRFLLGERDIKINRENVDLEVSIINPLSIGQPFLSVSPSISYESKCQMQPNSDTSLKESIKLITKEISAEINAATETKQRELRKLENRKI